VENEAVSLLTDCCEQQITLVSMLLSFRDYPAVADAFRKSNTTLPNSAAVERIFSAASQVLTARRCRLADVLWVLCLK